MSKLQLTAEEKVRIRKATSKSDASTFRIVEAILNERLAAEEETSVDDG